MVTVTTKQHIIENNNYSNCCGYSSLDGDYSNLDANSTKEDIQNFQKWINNKKGLNLTSGKWDEETAKLYLENGIVYDLIDNPNYVSNNPKPVADITKKGYYSNNFKFKPTPSTKYVPTDNAKDIKKGGMSTTTKVLIGVGIALVLGTSIYFITKK
jgi:hypothetical protein